MGNQNQVQYHKSFVDPISTKASMQGFGQRVTTIYNYKCI